MGCDIHLFTEIKVSSRDGGHKWSSLDNFKKNFYFDMEGEKEFVLNEIYKGRNYELFSLLANVRNYNEIPFISEPKGLPEDCLDFIKKESDEWGADGHSHSYLTLSEMKAFVLENPGTKTTGMVSEKTAKDLDEIGKLPQEWCKSTSASGWVYREWIVPSPVQTIIDLLEERVEDFYHFNVKDEDVRIVFWFDN